MFLKSLEIFGFKSFADRTKIQFLDGITALLGPNGCGKSNVVDAVKWVLGEQASKTLRAGKMEDVIFKGTDTRKPLNVAEVTLTISNDGGILPLEYSEIAIKRRLYRSGESEYFVNGQPAKLKDIRELFWDTGVGKAAYSVMEQGKIDQILSSKPEERRYFFEEAAGITRYKARGAEAERNLQRTEENMRQAEGILAEVKRSHDTLKVQAEKAVKYRDFKEEIFQTELDIQLLKLKSFTRERDSRNEELEKIKGKQAQVRAEIEAINASLEQNMDVVNTMEKQISQLNQEIYGLAIEQKAKMDKAKLITSQRNDSKVKLEHIESRIRSAKETVENLRDEVDEQDALIHDFTKRVGEIKENIASFEDNIQKTSLHITNNDNQVVEIEKSIQDLDREKEAMEEELASITENIVTELDKSLKDAGYSSSIRLEKQEAVENSLKQLKIMVEGRNNIFADLKSSGASSESLIEAGTKAFSEIISALNDLESNLLAFTKSLPGFIDDFLAPEGIITKKRSVDQRISENREKVRLKKENISTLRTENINLSEKIEEYKNTLSDLNLDMVRVQTQIKSVEEQAGLIKRQLASQEASLKELENEHFSESKRLEEFDEQIGDLESEIADLEHKGRAITSQLTKLEDDIKSRNTDLSEKQEDLNKKSAEVGKYSGMIEKLNMEVVTSETEIRNLKNNFQEQYSRDLMEFEEKMYTINVPAGELREKLSQIRQKIKELGSVNFMAIEEFAEVKERYELLSKQLEDLKKAREDLSRITQEIRAESSELFMATYNKIKKNFHNMFRRLFGGGRAEIRLLDPANVLESGIDILAQPPGKKMESISLLSGGERSMTAVSLLFAAYMVKPSPFCLLDEIDAALDDQNVLRFVTTLREFSSKSQYIVITHNKKTGIGSSHLLGVTMQEPGVTKVITIKMQSEPGVFQETLPDIEPFEEEEVEPETDVYLPPHVLTRGGRVQETGEQTGPEDASGETVSQNEHNGE